MSRIAIATCGGEVRDPDAPLLSAALEAEGIDAELRVWDDPSVRWGDYDLTVIRSTWDYTAKHLSYLEWAKDVPRLHNPYDVVRYSSDKHYLGDMASRGHLVVPSFFADVSVDPRFPDGDFVVKPSVGAGSMQAARYRAYETEGAKQHVRRLHDMGRDVIIQPYVSSVDERGERALIFIDGEFSHAMTKGAMLNTDEYDRNALFRWEQMSVAQGEPESLALAKDVLAGLEFATLLYARVDLVHTPEGWALMELELVEPSLFLSFNDEAPAKFAKAIAKRL
jgi:glutathione synthase/RimK-type ligase-like ATP-grasp enzyme